MRSRTCRSWLVGCRAQTRRLGRASGFTLIEILVVVTIIALLLAILLPSLKRAREQAQAIVCKSGMRQLTLGMHTYSSSDRRLPGTGGVWWAAYADLPGPKPKNPDGKEWPDWRKSDVWLGLLCARAMWDVDQQQALWDHIAITSNVPREGSLWRYVSDEKVFLCAKDKKGMPDPANPAGGGGNGRFSYTMNTVLGFMAPERAQSFTYVADFQQKPGAMPAPYPHIPAGTRVVWEPSRMLLLMEEHPWNNTNHGFVNDGWAADSYLALRHDPQRKDALANFAYLDGHVAAKRYPYTGEITDPAGNPLGTFQGVDLINEYRFPYSYASNQGGEENSDAFITHFPYPYK